MKRRLTGKPYQVPVPRLVLREHKEVVVLRLGIGLAPMVVLLADVQLTSQNGLQRLLLHRLKEVHRPKDVSVIGDRR